jgi:hypothetical protein
MKRFALLGTLTVALCSAYAVEKPSFHTQGTRTGKPAGSLKPGEYSLAPGRAVVRDAGRNKTIFQN